MNKHKEPVRMACGHYRFYSLAHPLPVPGDYMYCLQCMKETHCPYPLDRDVDNKPIIGEWRWKCRSKNCRMDVKTGKSKTEAVRQASRHIQRSPRHYVHIIQPDGIIVERFGYDPDDYGLFRLNGVDSEPIPF